MDGRKNNGARKGENRGAGRKPKADEDTLLQRLSPLDDIAFTTLKAGLVMGDATCLKLFMGYRFGQPKQTIDTNLTGELNISWLEQKTYEANEETNEGS